MVIYIDDESIIKVDRQDYDLSYYKWYVKGGYAQRSVWIKSTPESKLRSMHRIIVQRMVGRVLLSSEQVDHINGDKLDNRRANLRPATNQQNMWNRGSRSGSSSRYVGVAYYPITSRWIARIKVSGYQINIGYFPTELEAAWMRDQYALALHGDFACLNLKYVPIDGEDSLHAC
ncbi:HNH endonuclease [Arthrobacter sp. AL12]|uniref:HNH endonuclease n=1 Tax=Arthrobacter sp. AL12 TaxID=3042241 RepID=UPI00249A1822|nr:HNH endonuclease [Arthrobacter sp. AL12]MDI3211784.1 HNH endonuclease [Arthrobacter sp. AL12]